MGDVSQTDWIVAWSSVGELPIDDVGKMFHNPVKIRVSLLELELELKPEALQFGAPAFEALEFNTLEFELEFIL